MCVDGLYRREVGLELGWSQPEVGLESAWNHVAVVQKNFKNSNLKNSDSWSRMGGVTPFVLEVVRESCICDRGFYPCAAVTLHLSSIK